MRTRLRLLEKVVDILNMEKGVLGGNMRYKAFLSYSSADRNLAVKLQRTLEKFVLPRALRKIRPGIRLVRRPVRPIFRDEDELVPGQDLGDRIRDALEKSEFLIVLCSEASAKSRWVEREIIEFTLLGRGDSILAVIPENKGKTAEEIIPRALRFKIDPAGAITDEAVEPLYVEWRGRVNEHTAILRLIAALLQLSSFDDLVRRDARSRKYRRIRGLLFWFITLLTFAVGTATITRLADSNARRLAAASEIASSAGHFGRGVANALAALDGRENRREFLTSLSAALYANRLQRQLRFQDDQPFETEIAALSNAGRLVVMASKGDIRAFDTNKGAALWRLKGSFTAVAISDGSGTIAAAREDGKILIFNWAGSLLRQINGNGGAISRLTFSPDGSALAAGGKDLTIHVWTMKDGNTEAIFQGHAKVAKVFSGEVQDIAFTHDGKQIASSVTYDDVRIWDRRTGRQVATLEALSANSIAFPPDPTTVLVASDQMLFVWDLKQNKLKTIIQTGLTFEKVGYSPDGKHIFAVNGTDVAIWNTAGEITTLLSDATDDIISTRFNPDGRSFSALSRSGQYVEWDATDRWRPAQPNEYARVAAKAYSADGKLAVARRATAKGAERWSSIRLDTSAKSVRWTQGRSTAHLVLPNGRKALAGLENGEIELWDLRPDSALTYINAHEGPVTALLATKDSRHFVSASSDGVIKIFDAMSLDTTHSIAIGSPILAIFMSYDGSRFMWGAEDGTLGVTAINGRTLMKTKASGPVEVVAISRDGKTLFSFTSQGKGALRSAETGNIIAYLPMESAIAADISPDGAQLLVIGKDQTLVFWDVQSQTITGSLILQRVGGAAFLDDGKSLLVGTGGQAEPLKVYPRPLPPKQGLIDIACKIPGTFSLPNYGRRSAIDPLAGEKPDPCSILSRNER